MEELYKNSLIEQLKSANHKHQVYEDWLCRIQTHHIDHVMNTSESLGESNEMLKGRIHELEYMYSKLPCASRLPLQREYDENQED